MESKFFSIYLIRFELSQKRRLISKNDLIFFYGRRKKLYILKRTIQSGEKKVKKIGLVGGTGPESTLMYYKELNTGIDEATGGKNMPDIAIESVNFRKVWEMAM